MLGLILKNSLLNYGDIVLFSSFGPSFRSSLPQFRGFLHLKNAHLESVGIGL